MTAKSDLPKPLYVIDTLETLDVLGILDADNGL